MTRWMASYKERYFFITPTLDVNSVEEDGFGIDDDFYKAGNYFKTKKEAEEVAAKLRAVLEEHHEAKEGGKK